MRGIIHIGDVFLQNEWFFFCLVVTHLGYPTAINTAACPCGPLLECVALSIVKGRMKQ